MDPKPFDKRNFETAFRGDVTPQGSKILARNDEGVEQINKAGVDEAQQVADRQGRSQQRRALRDAVMFTDPLQEDNDPSARCSVNTWPRGLPSAPW